MSMLMASLTVNLALYLAIYVALGELKIPDDITYEGYISLVTWLLPSYLLLLAIPKTCLYFTGKKTWRIMFCYLLLPFISWLLLSINIELYVAWWLIAAAAWTEVFEIAIKRFQGD